MALSKLITRRHAQLIGLANARPNEPLESDIDNVLSSRIGEIACAATAVHHSDNSDTGLILLQLLEEQGFVLYFRPTK